MNLLLQYWYQPKKIINKMKAGFSHKSDKIALLGEAACNDFEQKVMKEILYLPNRLRFVLEFIIELLKYNSDWRYNVDTYGDGGFIPGDLKLIEYFYNGILVCGFQADLNNKKDIDKKTFDDIVFLKICYVLQNNSELTEIVSGFEEYFYRKSDISIVLEKFHGNKNKVIHQLKMKLNNYMTKTNITEYDKSIITELLKYTRLLNSCFKIPYCTTNSYHNLTK